MLKKLSFFLLLFSLSSSFLFAQNLDDNNDAKKLYNAGISEFKSGNYNGAIAKLDEALALTNDYRLHAKKGDALRKQKKYEEAITSYDEAIKLNDKYYASYFYKASALFALEKYEEAKAAFELTKTITTSKKVIASCDSNIEKCDEKLAYPLIEEGDKQMSSSNFAAAIASYNKFLEMIQNDGVYVKLAEAYIKSGDYANALSASENAIKYRTKKSKVPQGAAYYYKGLAYKGLDDKVKAKENFEIALKDSKYKANSKYELDLLN